MSNLQLNLENEDLRAEVAMYRNLAIRLAKDLTQLDTVIAQAFTQDRKNLFEFLLNNTPMVQGTKNAMRLKRLSSLDFDAASAEEGMTQILKDPGEQSQARDKISIDRFLAQHLKMWIDSGIPAPVNELQSIGAWLSSSGRMTKEELQTSMRMRMLLLMNAVNELHARGPEAEDEAGIYDNRPDKRPPAQ